MHDKPVTICDTTLRDGTQGEGFQLSSLDQLRIAQRLAGFLMHATPKSNFLTTMRQPIILLTLLTLLTLLMAGCKRKADIAPGNGIVFTTLNNHKVTTWVNDEPALVCSRVFYGYNKPYWLTLQAGENTIRFTAERLPGGMTDGIASRQPDGRNDGSTMVKIISGNILSKPKDIIRWIATADSQTSPAWTVRSDIAWRPALESYDAIDHVDDATKAQIADFLASLKTALNAKDLSPLGYQNSDFDFLMKQVGFKCAMAKDVFGAEPYQTSVSPMSELEIIHGKKTIMIYRRDDDEGVFYAGRSREAPSENGEISYFLAPTELYFVKEKGTLKPLWIKSY
ncbi:MAG: hypothetical protein NTW21_42450 [Verrucomicrobia bacterium]|nr:hypothetical protein [Verrucomicrobiota bacterium]